jgi:RNA polymerase sigma-70 factor (ECF subfamily)
MNPTPDDVTGLLHAYEEGDEDALARLMPLVYGELRRLAARALRRERSGHTLQPTALVHEAYLRLVDQHRAHLQSRAHFYAVAAQIMRRILVDHARFRGRHKRGGAVAKVSLDEAFHIPKGRAVELVSLDDALHSLAEIDPQQARVVELRYFGGLTIEETADVAGISPATVKRDWVVAKAWLQRELIRE